MRALLKRDHLVCPFGSLPRRLDEVCESHLQFGDDGVSRVGVLLHFWSSLEDAEK
ncbi:hypothetical protein D3C86_2243400 [compost metagenome]